MSGQAGQASVELAGSLWLVILAALAAWQLALAGWTAIGAANAARTAARAYSRTGDAASAAADAHQSLQGEGLDHKSSINFHGGTATAIVKIPLLVPGVTWPKNGMQFTVNADMPSTG